MEKIRISSLAKELGVKSHLLIEKCHEKGLTHINHHANTLVPEQAEMIRKLFQPAAKVTPPKEMPKVKEAATTQTVDQKKETWRRLPVQPLILPGLFSRQKLLEFIRVYLNNHTL